MGKRYSVLFNAAFYLAGLKQSNKGYYAEI